MYRPLQNMLHQPSILKMDALCSKSPQYLKPDYMDCIPEDSILCTHHGGNLRPRMVVDFYNSMWHIRYLLLKESLMFIFGEAYPRHWTVASLKLLVFWNFTLCSLVFWRLFSWRCRQDVHAKCWYLFTRLYCVTSQKTLCVLIAVRSANLTIPRFTFDSTRCM